MAQINYRTTRSATLSGADLGGRFINRLSQYLGESSHLRDELLVLFRQ